MRSIVCRSACLSVGLSVTLVSPAKTAEPIEMPFGLRTWLDPRDHVLDGGSDPPMGRDKFWGENGRPIVKYRDILRSSVERRLNQQRCRLVCGLRWVQGIVSYMGVQIPRGKGQFWAKGLPILKYRNLMPCSVQIG